MTTQAAADLIGCSRPHLVKFHSLKLADIIDLNPEVAINSFKKLVLNRRNPKLDAYQVLDHFRRNNLKDTADYLHALLSN